MNKFSLHDIEDPSDCEEIVSAIERLHKQFLRLVHRQEMGVGSTHHLQIARQLCRLRSGRAKFIGIPTLFGEPAWDMLLNLYVLSVEQRKTSVTGICLASGAPPTTALRWLHKLDENGLVVRHSDERDARRVWVRLSDVGFRRMNDLFNAVVNQQIISERA